MGRRRRESGLTFKPLLLQSYSWATGSLVQDQREARLVAFSAEILGAVLVNEGCGGIEADEIGQANVIRPREKRCFKSCLNPTFSHLSSLLLRPWSHSAQGCTMMHKNVANKKYVRNMERNNRYKTEPSCLRDCKQHSVIQYCSYIYIYTYMYES